MTGPLDPVTSWDCQEGAKRPQLTSQPYLCLEASVNAGLRMSDEEAGSHPEVAFRHRV